MSKEERDALTDPDGKSKGYQAGVPSLSRRINEVMRSASKSLSETVSAILGDLRYQNTFHSKAEAYAWLRKTPTMDAVNALVKQAQALPAPQRRRLMRQIESGAKVARMSRLEALDSALKINKAVIVEGVKRNVAPAMKMLSKDAYLRQTYTLQKQVGVGWSVDEPPAGQIVAGMNSTLEKMAEWYHGPLDQKTRDRIVEGIATGKTHAQIAREIDVYEHSPARAKAVARTMITTVSNEAEMRALKDTSIKRYEYVATLDERTCPVCGALDGRTFRLDDAKAGVNFPPMHPNCRCVHIAALSKDIKAELTRSARIDGMSRTVPASMTYAEWARIYAPARAPREPQRRRINDNVAGSVEVYSEEELEDLRRKAFNGQSLLDVVSVYKDTESKQKAVNIRADMINSIPTRIDVKEGSYGGTPTEYARSIPTEEDNVERSAHIKKVFDESEWVDSLTSDEDLAVRSYTGSAYRVLNGPLYNERFFTYKSEYRGDIFDSEEFERYANTHVEEYRHLDTALAKGELKEPITVVRHSRSNPFGDVEIQPDEIYSVPNYWSTSAYEGIWDGEYRIVVRVPEGKGRGAYVESISRHKNEREFLIKRNSRYIVDKYDRESKTIWCRLIS